MDVVINSQIQSPLVRTLARTKGKSQSFTHSIADNVPPCSFTKIQVGAQNASEDQFGRSYKLKIPQYGYLRDVILKYTTRENTISDKVVTIVKSLFTENAFSLEDVRIAGSYLHSADPNTTTPVATQTPDRACDLTWYNLQNIVQNATSKALNANNLNPAANFDSTYAEEVRTILAPQFAKLLRCSSVTASSSTGIIGNNGIKGGDGTKSIPCTGYTENTTGGTTKYTTANVEELLTDVAGSVGSAQATTVGTQLYSGGWASSYSQAIKINGDPKMWSAIMRLYYNIYLLAKEGESIPAMIWEQLKAEPSQSINENLWTTYGLVGTNATTIAPLSSGVMSATSGFNTSTAGDVSVLVQCTLPKFVTVRRKGGKNLWVPKLPQLQFDSDGTAVGVNFIPLDFIHPNDNDDVSGNLKFNNLSSSVATYNFRSYAFGDDDDTDEDWSMWDWQTESFYYQGLAANVAERVQLSTHNRPIQTVFPHEIYTRVQKLPPAERQRYLKMMKARVSKTGKLDANAGSNGHAGEKTMYFPLFLSSTENPSLNFDTRFVEQLDIDVITRDVKDVFSTVDTTPQNTSLPTLYEWIDNYRTNVFGGDFGTGPGMTLPDTTQTFTVPSAISTLLDNLSVVGAISEQPSSYATYSLQTPRSFVIDLRSFNSVPSNYIKVEALLYYHNFHDTTAQAIRDSNFKPGTPASLLSYNTYLETPVQLTNTQLQNTQTINVNLTTNNLVFGTTFFVRRRKSNPKEANKRDHNMQTLRIKNATLTASGQQIYTSSLDESQITDPFDYDLASGKIGRKYNNSLISQAIDDPYTGESFFMYHIPFGFSSDMTYNSGSIAFQTLNNPVLSVTVDIGTDASQPVDTTIGDGEFELVVLHNYWQMIRIDSNTGSITRSLDL